MERNTQIRAIIIDDELKAREILKRLIASYCPKLEVVAEGNDISSGIEVINAYKPDLVFLDIHLDTQNSFDLLGQITDKNFDIIFTSGHSTYGVSAFKVNAIDYLLKPIDSDDLISAVEKVRQKKAVAVTDNSVTIAIHVNDCVEYISSSQICTLKADSNYTEILTSENKKYITAKTLSDLEEILKATKQFIRIHRSIVINSKYISSYSKTEPFYLSINNGASYEISRRKKGEVLAFLKTMEN